MDTLETAAPEASDWWNSSFFQEWAIEKPVNIGLTIIIAFVANLALRTLISRLAARSLKTPNKLKRALSVTPNKSATSNLDATAQNTREQRRRARIQTIATVGKSVASFFVWTCAFLSILSTLGVNVAPLIASAGVIGVAVGFGAQSLVRDFISGMFMLLEDQYGIGDTIDVGNGVVGTVRDIGIRVTTLQDLEGTTWYVRHGEILRVGNHTHDYTLARIKIPVSASADLEKAWEVIEDSFGTAIDQPEIKSLVRKTPSSPQILEIKGPMVTFATTIQTTPGHEQEVERYVYGQVFTDLRDAQIETSQEPRHGSD